jgi:hypothetical protein
MLDQLIDARFLYPIVIVSLVGAAELGAWFGRRLRQESENSEPMTTLTASALGLLALLLAFSLSHALSRYEVRRALVLEEANAHRQHGKIGHDVAEGSTTGNFRPATRICRGAAWSPRCLGSRTAGT